MWTSNGSLYGGIGPWTDPAAAAQAPYMSAGAGEEHFAGATSAERELHALLGEVQGLLDALTDAESVWASQIGRVHDGHGGSAVNLAHYWAVRQYDLRDLQRRLAVFGLSSLGRSEPHVAASLDAILAAARALMPVAGQGPGDAPARAIDFAEGGRLLRRRTIELLGPEPKGRQTRIMVTLPPEAATDGGLVRALVANGMDVARINCAHDDEPAWRAMIDHVHQASAATGRPCRIAMDLAGPKLRTGPLVDGPRVVRLRPKRDAYGRVTAPAWAWLTPRENPHPPRRPELSPVTIPVPGSFLVGFRDRERIRLLDTREASRSLVVESVDAEGALVRTDRTTYLATGTQLRSPAGSAQVGELPAIPGFLNLHVGDTLVLTRDLTPAPVSDEGPMRIGCTLPEAFDHVEVGQSVHLDDGKISGVIEAVTPDEVTLRITVAAAKGTKLRAAKGINLPDTVLPLPALTDTDRACLPFVVAHADLVEMSFVRGPEDVEDLLSALEELGPRRPGVVIKIETAQGFTNLPAILLTAMRWPSTGAMIARGDLAVEVGYERMAELQEEIMWLCEAAHLPVIWATQVLDQMARSGQPSRAEVTDAALGGRAECVMLNKGAHVVDAVVTLDDILRRMSAHHYKKNALMRPLRSWRLAETTAAETTVAETPAADGEP